MIGYLIQRKEIIVLILLILIGFFLRGYKLSEIPLYGDELTIVLDANSLLHTGKDQTGQFLPLTFSMGAGRPAGYVYGSIPFVVLFGVTEWGVRGLSLLSGLLLILIMYFFTKKLLGKRIGIIASFLITFSFWDINLSRGGFEAHFALLLVIVGIFGLISSKKNQWWITVSALCFGLTLHTYPTYKVVLPLFLLLLGGLYFLDLKRFFAKNKSVFFIALFIFLFLSGLSVLQTFTGGSENRFLAINVFSDPEVSERIIQKVNYERSTSSLPYSVSSLFHNRIIEYIKVVAENYIHNLSWDFLFLHGDKNPRHNMSTLGYFYLIESITMLLGFMYLFVTRQKKLIIFLVGWILISPIGTALVADPHGLRSAFMFPPLILLSAIGINYISIIRTRYLRNLLLLFIIFAFFGQFIYFGEKLYFLAPNAYGRFWADSGKFATEEAMRQSLTNDVVILSDKIDSIEYAYPAYAHIQPEDVIMQHPKNTRLLGEEYSFKKFGNVYIGHIPVENLRQFGEANSTKSIVYIGTIEDKNSLERYMTLRSCEQKEILVVSSINR